VFDNIDPALVSIARDMILDAFESKMKLSVSMGFRSRATGTRMR
jgi:hypothetical protein